MTNKKKIRKSSVKNVISTIAENPIISIITPYYNCQKYIEETAKSVLSQTFENFEWIIVDDGSSEEGIEKLKQIKKLDSRIKVFWGQNGINIKLHKNSQKGKIEPTLSDQNYSKGPAQARDFGIRNSSKSSKYIVFLDADDLFDKTFLECCYWTLETHPKASWAYTDSINFGARNFLWRKWYDPEWEKKENILIVSACIRKKDLLEVGCFGVKEKRVYEDWYLWLKLIKAGKYPIRMNSLLTYYRQKKESGELKETNTKNKKNALRLIELVKRDMIEHEEAVQFPKFDYNWEEIQDENENIEIDKKEKNNTEKTNILMIFPWMITGGADRFNLNLVSKMNKEKFNFTIITTLPSTNEWRKYFEKHATVYDLTTFLDIKDWTSFINYIIKKEQINMIFNSNSQFGYKILPYLKANFPEIPIVDYVHMEEWYWRNGGYSRDSSILHKVIDRTFTCNENSRNIFINYFKRKKSEVKTMYIGVDEKKFNPDLYNKINILKELNLEEKISNKTKVISYICRIADQKRPYLFFEIIKELSKIREDFVVIVAGDGPFFNGLKNKVVQNNLKEKFIFLGNMKVTEKVYKISDITVNTSIKEGLALTSYESLSMGVPVVSSDVGGQRELITEDVGVIVPCMQEEKEILNLNYSEEEIKNYVEAINKVLEKLEFYKSNCRQKILKGFTIDNMIKKMEKEFLKICEKPNQQKVENGKSLGKNKEILKELISTYIISGKPDYEWLVEEFNRKNVHKMEICNKKSQFYEHTLEYKLKHPIVVVLRKMGIYENCRKILGLS